MAHFLPSNALTLPRGWSHRLRSAVVQVISLARTSLALTQGWAEESMNPALRHQAEEDRLDDAAFRGAGEIPRDLISDQGIQFTARGFRRWCHRHGIRHRFGALG